MSIPPELAGAIPLIDRFQVRAFLIPNIPIDLRYFYGCLEKRDILVTNSPGSAL
jgi:hypothetical protein